MELLLNVGLLQDYITNYWPPLLLTNYRIGECAARTGMAAALDSQRPLTPVLELTARRTVCHGDCSDAVTLDRLYYIDQIFDKHLREWDGPRASHKVLAFVIPHFPWRKEVGHRHWRKFQAGNHLSLFCTEASDSRRKAKSNLDLDKHELHKTWESTLQAYDYRTSSFRQLRISWGTANQSKYLRAGKVLEKRKMASKHKSSGTMGNATPRKSSHNKKTKKIQESPKPTEKKLPLGLNTAKWKTP